MASIEGHRVFVLTVSYPGDRTRQLSLRRERVAEVRRWLRNYQELKEAHFEQSLATLQKRRVGFTFDCCRIGAAATEDWDNLRQFVLE
jgi:hypothetical protein